MYMRGAVSFRKRAGKEFVRSAGWLLVAYGVVAAILILAAGVPLGGALIVGGIGVPAVAALLAVVSVWAGGTGDPSSRPYDYDPGSDPVLRSGGGYGASGGWHDYGGSDGGAGDGGGAGGDGGG